MPRPGRGRRPGAEHRGQLDARGRDEDGGQLDARGQLDHGGRAEHGGPHLEPLSAASTSTAAGAKDGGPVLEPSDRRQFVDGAPSTAASSTTAARGRADHLG